MPDKIPQLRIVVTSLCGRFCMYCRPGGEGFPVAQRRELTLAQITEVVSHLTRHGISELKITGGDPMLRDDILEIVQELKQLEGILSVHLVTRHPRAGEQAQKLRDAGLDCLNFSLDSLEPNTWSILCGGVDGHEQLVSAIRRAAETGITLKINMVVLNGINDHEIPDLIKFAGQVGASLKLEDLVTDVPAFPSTEADFGQRYYFDLEQVLPVLAQNAIEVDTEYQPGGLGHPMPRFRMRNGIFVTVKSIKNGAWYGDVCASCPRFPCHDAIMALRLTPDGKLQRCLLRGDNLMDLLDLIHHGATREQIDDVVDRVLRTYREAVFYEYTALQHAHERRLGHPSSRE